MNQLLYFLLGILATLLYQGTLELAFAQEKDIPTTKQDQEYIEKIKDD